MLMGSTSIGCSKSKPKAENFSEVADDDPEMAAAITKARQTLPEFWAIHDSPKNGETGFALKVKITDPNGAEHFWVNNLKRSGGKTTGTINNNAEIVRSVKNGDQITIPEADISDWMYVRGGKIHGNETVKALYKTMSPEEAAAVKEMMANP
jgi:uncharacterized protein YegJ (DUF2314 family)